MRKGQEVKIKKEFCGENENPNEIYIVVEDRDSRVLITPKQSELSIKPQESVMKYMLKAKK